MPVLSPIALPLRGKTFLPKTPGGAPVYVREVGPVPYDEDYFLFYGARIEVQMMAVTGEVFARLWDETVGAAVSGSVISTTSSTLIRVRSGLFTGLVSGREYKIQGGRAPGHEGAWKFARLLIYEGEP